MGLITATATGRRIPFRRLPGFSDLFCALAAGDAAALEFFAGDWRNASHRDAVTTAVLEAPRDRELIVRVLAEQNATWGNDDPEALASLQHLLQTDCATIVTGQQLGLFGGPIYTLYKAITAIQLARAEQARTGRPFVPVFWLADEDHDWEEVRVARFVAGNEIAQIELPPDDERTPVGRRVLGDDVTRALRQLDALAPSEFSDALRKALEDAYVPGTPMRDAFARWMRTLFAGTGLLLISGDDMRLKRLARPVFEQELEDPAATLGALLDASEGLEQHGYHRQVTPMAGNLFLMEPEGRFTLDPAGEERYALRGLERTCTLQALLQRLEDAPGDFSPNVVLRPVVADRLLPTAAYVAGPGEAAYYAQLHQVYQLFGVPMPIVYPRVSASLVEGRIARLMERHDIDLEHLGPDEQDLERLHRDLSLAAGGHNVEEAFTAAARQLTRAAADLKPLASSVDATLEKSADALRASLLKELEAFKTRVVRAEKRNHEQVRSQLERVHTHLFPAGGLQERTITPLHLLNVRGQGLVRHLLSVLDLDTSEHQVVRL